MYVIASVNVSMQLWRCLSVAYVASKSIYNNIWEAAVGDKPVVQVRAKQQYGSVH